MYLIRLADRLDAECERNSNKQQLDDCVCNQVIPPTEEKGLRRGAVLREYQDFGLLY